jgi:pimeloyl-ACP methyl ester carboxylesterase
MPTSAMPKRDDALFYQLYFQTPGVAEAELERDVRATVLKTLFSGSGDVPRRAAGSGDAARPATADGHVGMVPRDGGFLTRMPTPAVLPAWLSEKDIDFYAGEFARTGFRGGLNWYRNIDRNWELLAPFAGAKVTVPALYVAGDRDLVVAFRNVNHVIANLTKYVPQLRGTIMLPGCGHWTQQERAAEVNAAMIEFLRRL